MFKSMIKKIISIICFFAIGIGFVFMTTNAVQAKTDETKTTEKNEIYNASTALFSNVEEIKESKKAILKDIKITDERMQVLRSEINFLEKELSEMNIDIEEELREKVAEFEDMLQSVNSIEEYQQIQSMLSSTQYILYEYEIYLNSTIVNMNMQDVHTMGIGDVPPINPIYTPVLAYFSYKGYNLAYELLAHMATNNEFNSIYRPYYGYLVNSSELFQGIVQSGGSHDSGTFSDNGTVLGGDLFHAIHSFEYTRSDSGRAVVLTDYYDYKFGWEGYTTWAGTAVNLMYMLQVNGVLTPFYTIIETEVSKTIVQPAIKTISKIGTSGSSSRHLENIITLGKGEYQDYHISFSTSGYKNIQTLGYNDAYLEVYNSNGSMISYNDDGGYKRNAFINYYFNANTTYKIRVRFWSSSAFGDIKWLITPSNNSSFDSITQIVKEGWWIFGSFKVTVNATPNYVNLYRFIPSEPRGLCSIYTDNNGNSDPYIYLIDPRLPILLVPLNPYSPHAYNDDSGRGSNSYFEKELSGDVPYLIIGSLYNITNSGSYTLHAKYITPVE